MRHSTVRLLILALILTQCGSFVFAQNAGSPEHWIATWAASAQQPPTAVPPAAPTAPAAPAPAAGAGQRGGGGGQRGLAALNDQTMRMVVRTSIGGQRVRVEFSNAYGTTPLTLGAAHVGLRSKDSALIAVSDRALTFNGKPSVKIPPGAAVLSDAVALDIPKLADLAITVYAPGETGPATRHSMALHNAYVVSGDATSQSEFSGATTS